MSKLNIHQFKWATDEDVNAEIARYSSSVKGRFDYHRVMVKRSEMKGVIVSGPKPDVEKYCGVKQCH